MPVLWKVPQVTFSEGTTRQETKRRLGQTSLAESKAEQSVSASDSGAQSSLEYAIGIRQMNQGGLRCKAKKYKAARDLTRACAARGHTRRLAGASQVMW